eukprot:CAMPEP_0115089620 /NCGR_PEP_ID=MMETSP0227-20121206/24834_1 /TAXON_ID=89957 /ORGANISM="Polarella glacialis, Strain CCMP 1383" /LENGTH=522 /DNA_ID=CAMNT_0002480393 /DNA_START=199 /DNA_END=1763 /DNA_ORIENTATION=+
MGSDLEDKEAERRRAWTEEQEHNQQDAGELKAAQVSSEKMEDNIKEGEDKAQVEKKENAKEENEETEEQKVKVKVKEKEKEKDKDKEKTKDNKDKDKDKDKKDKKDKSEKKEKKDKDKGEKEKSKEPEVKDLKKKVAPQVGNPVKPRKKLTIIAGTGATARDTEAEEAAFFSKAAANEDFSNFMLEVNAEDANLDAVEGLDPSTGDSSQWDGLVAGPRQMAATPLEPLEDNSPELTESVPLQPQEVEFLTEHLPCFQYRQGRDQGYLEFPSWSSMVALVAEAKVAVSFGSDASASITALTPTSRCSAALLLRKVLEYSDIGGVEVDPGSRQSFTTVINIPSHPVFGYQAKMLSDLCIKYKVLIFPARAQESEASFLRPGGCVEVRINGQWATAKLVKLPETRGGDYTVVVDNGGQHQVQVSVLELRAGFNMLAIFGDRMCRASAQLKLMSNFRRNDKGFDFGISSSAALGPDDDWGSYRRVFQAPSFCTAFTSNRDNRLDKVLAPASGCAFAFINNMAVAAG